MIESDMIIKLIILVAILSLVYTTIKAVVTGVKEGVQNTKDILGGASYEQIRQRNKQKQDDAFKDIGQVYFSRGMQGVPLRHLRVFRRLHRLGDAL